MPDVVIDAVVALAVFAGIFGLLYALFRSRPSLLGTSSLDGVLDGSTPILFEIYSNT